MSKTASNNALLFFRRAILSNPDLLPSTPWHHLLENDFWGTPLTDSGSHGSYRPLCVLTFRLNYLLGGFQPWGYHLVNVLLHCLATALLVRVARQVLPKTRSSVGSAVTGLVFATHPIHTEAVAGVVGRADLAACNFYLLAFLTYIAHAKYRDVACCGWDLIASGEKAKTCRAPRYQKFVVDIQKNVVNCSWSKRLGREVVAHSRPSSLSWSKQIEAWCEEDQVTCCWTRWWKAWGCLLLSTLLAVASMLSKETGVTVLGVCAVFDFVKAPQISKVSVAFFIKLYYTYLRAQTLTNCTLLT